MMRIKSMDVIKYNFTLKKDVIHYIPIKLQILCSSFRTSMDIFQAMTLNNSTPVLFMGKCSKGQKTIVNGLSLILLPCWKLACEEALDGHALPLFGDRGLDALQAGVSDVIATEAEDQALDDPAGAGEKVGVAAALRLREHPERPPQVALVRLLEVLVGRVRVQQPAIEDGEDGEGHRRRALVGDAGLVVGEVAADLPDIGDGLERVGEQVDIGLLDVLAVVAAVLPGHVVLHLQDHDLLADLGVLPVLGQLQPLRCHVVQPQRLLGHRVGEGVVIHVLRPLVCSHHVPDVVPVCPLLHPAAPKLRDGGQDRKALLREPLQVLRDCEVVPGGEGHAPADVVLQRPGEGPHRSLLDAGLRTFPGEHGPAVAVDEGVVPRRIQPLETVLDERPGEGGIEAEDSRIDPEVHVPEDVAVVAESAEAHRTDPVALEVVDEGVAVVEHQPHVLLVLLVPLDHDIVGPQLLPQSAVGGEEGLLADEHAPLDDADGLVDRVLVVGGGDERADEAQLVDLAFRDTEAGLEQMIVRIPVLMREFVLHSLLLRKTRGDHEIQLPSLGRCLRVHNAQPCQVLVVLLDIVEVFGSLVAEDHFERGCIVGDDLDGGVEGEGEVLERPVGVLH